MGYFRDMYDTFRRPADEANMVIKMIEAAQEEDRLYDDSRTETVMVIFLKEYLETEDVPKSVESATKRLKELYPEKR